MVGDVLCCYVVICFNGAANKTLAEFISGIINIAHRDSFNGAANKTLAEYSVGGVELSEDVRLQWGRKQNACGMDQPSAISPLKSGGFNGAANKTLAE